jgi:hypothetical protein
MLCSGARITPCDASEIIAQFVIVSSTICAIHYFCAPMAKVSIPRNPEFGERLKQAFGGASVEEIRSRLGLQSYNGARNYLLGRVPEWDKLVRISEITGCSVHWLLTGEGPMRFGDAVEGMSMADMREFLLDQVRILGDARDLAEEKLLEVTGAGRLAPKRRSDKKRPSG